MANGRNDTRSRRDSGRDAGRFIGLPVSVLDCPNFEKLSHPARSLLLEVALQFNGDDNGRMLLSTAHLAKRGWRSADVIQRAKRQLLEYDFIFETVKGHRPNKASWYAVTWRKLDRLKGFDPGAEVAFEQGAYKRGVHMPEVKKSSSIPLIRKDKLAIQNAAVIPPDGTKPLAIVPSDGTANHPPVPPHGTMQCGLRGQPIPRDGYPLEKPSIAGAEVVAVGVNGHRPTKRHA
jgi:hypothetical protein